MKVGDRLLYVGGVDFDPDFTKGKKYVIYKIEEAGTYYKDDRCCWILSDNDSHVYFKESEAMNDYFKCLEIERKQKLKKIYEIH